MMPHRSPTNPPVEKSGQSPSPEGHEGATGQAAPWPLCAAVSVQVDSTHSLVHVPVQVPAQWAHGAASESAQAPQSSRTLGLAAQQAHSSTPATSVASCYNKPSFSRRTGKRRAL